MPARSSPSISRLCLQFVTQSYTSKRSSVVRTLFKLLNRRRSNFLYPPSYDAIAESNLCPQSFLIHRAPCAVCVVEF